MATSKYINMIKEFDENLSGLEDIFGDISSAVDFYNAVTAYNNSNIDDCLFLIFVDFVKY